MIKHILEQEYHNLCLWYCVSYIGGIIAYFTLSSEPSLIIMLSFPICALLLSTLRLNIRLNIFWSFVLRLVIAFFLGMLISKYRVYTRTSHTFSIFHQLLNSSTKDNYHHELRSSKECVISPIEGRIEEIKPTMQGSRIILQQVKIYKTQQILSRIRITLPTKYSKKIGIDNSIKIVAKLCKPQNSLLPGGYDFSFYAYFNNLAATGYALAPPEIISYNTSATNNFIYKIRKNIYTKLIQALGSIDGNFAAAILLGETKALDKNIIQAMRQGGISHILCVSGLHLSLVATILFIATRFLLNLSNIIAYNYNVKSIAAICSLIGSYGYLELTSMQIAATRAFIMTAIVIYAIMSERSIHPLRSLAVAAFVILSINPEFIFYPSFQLSFIAVLSLTSGYEFYIKNQWILGESKGIFATIKFYCTSNIYSSLLAGVITAPVVINQFYTFPTYSIIMNLIAVPIMSFFLMPLSLISLLLMIFGIEGYCLKLAGFFIDLIIKSVNFTNLLPGTVWYFGYISKFSLITFLFGFFWLCIWQTSWRFLGLIIILISFILMLASPLPNFILDIKTNIIGVKNANSELEIYMYSNKYSNNLNNRNLPQTSLKIEEPLTNFKRLYWTHWFGQKDAKIFYSAQNIFISQENKLLLNLSQFNQQKCQNADIYINFEDDNECLGNKMTFSAKYLKKIGVIMVFCNNKQCKAEFHNNRFNF